MPGKPKYYWDSCSFIAWIKGERSAPGDLEGLEEVAKMVDSNKAVLLTSEITKTEVLEGKMTQDQQAKFNLLFQRKNVVPIDVTGRVLSKTKVIREWNPKISLPDAIHLATAILYEADEFHTNDGGGKKKRAGDLLPLNGNVAGHKLKICKPKCNQYSIDFKNEQSAKAKEATRKAVPEASEVQGSSSGPPEGQTTAQSKSTEEQATEKEKRS